ncbi:MAG: GDP-mannose 4,6-dehydratase, partial [Actinomycetota bacterium]|nr:GDP-mannose 4,6-dehydratase [Actinomycetota bacterium]
MRALVTGVGGFVGAHLAARLVADGWEVAGTVRAGGDDRRLRALGVHHRVEVLAADLSDPA